MGLVKGKTLDKIVKEAVRFMVNELGAERAMVLVGEPGDPAPPVLGHYGLPSSDVWSGELVSTTLLKRVLAQGKPVMLMDAQQDFQYKGRSSIQASGCRSVLVVPVADPEGRVTGLLYADHKLEAAAFDYTTRDRLVQFGVDFNEAYGSLESKSLPRATPQAAPLAFQPPSPQAVLAVVAIVGFVLVTLVVSPPGTGPAATPTPGAPVLVTTAQAEPAVVVASYLRLLRSREYTQAWGFLGPSLQKRVPLQQYVTQARGWFSDELRRWNFQHRRIVPGERRETIAILYLEPGPQAKDKDRWTWTLQKTDTGWKLTDLKGGPVVVP